MQRRHAFLIALFLAASLPACANKDSGDISLTTAEPQPGAAESTAIRITFGETKLTGRLHDTATARDVAAQLPLTLNFRDHNKVEKTAPLPRPLSIDTPPGAHDPGAGDIGYWAPGADFVLYYDDEAPRFEGIVRIGEFDGDINALKRQSDGFRVTIAGAG
jgi:hypothetical protein